ncbi:MAG: rubredoxin [Rhodospirillales bacterium]
MRSYCCETCQYVFDPSVGDEVGGIEPGVAFTELPRGWRCPECGGDKSEFVALERGKD